MSFFKELAKPKPHVPLSQNAGFMTLATVFGVMFGLILLFAIVAAITQLYQDIKDSRQKALTNDQLELIKVRFFKRPKIFRTQFLSRFLTLQKSINLVTKTVRQLLLSP